MAALDGGIPGAHGCGGVGVALAGVALHVEPRSSKGGGSAETDSHDAELRDDVVDVGALRGVAHGEARDAHGGDVYHARADDAIPRDVGVLREVVMKGAEPGEIDGHETVFRA